MKPARSLPRAVVNLLPTFWDFYANPGGLKRGWITELSSRDCWLRTQSPLQEGRWLRLSFRYEPQGVQIIRSGRVIDASADRASFKLQFLAPLPHRHPLLCIDCQEVPGTVPSFRANTPGSLRCTRCHIRLACRELLAPFHDDSEVASTGLLLPPGQKESPSSARR